MGSQIRWKTDVGDGGEKVDGGSQSIWTRQWWREGGGGLARSCRADGVKDQGLGF